jgi:hypothetical protein
MSPENQKLSWLMIEYGCLSSGWSKIENPVFYQFIPVRVAPMEWIILIHSGEG